MMANKEEQAYLDLMKETLDSDDLDDRTGVGVYANFGCSLDFTLVGNTVPLITTKKMAKNSVINELALFCRGNTDTNWLSERKCFIWEANTRRAVLDKLDLIHLKEGDMGKLYPHQWRHYGKTSDKPGIDQLAEVIRLIKEDPTSRRIIINSWNTSDLKEMCLSPCHPLVQFYVNPKKQELSCMFVSRSMDAFLGASFNIFSYALLTHLIADITNLKAKKLTAHIGNFHI